MKFLILAVCVSAALCAPPRPGQAVYQAANAVAQGAATVARAGTGTDFEAPILRSESDVTAEGFNYVYETGNGISAQAQGSLKKVDNQDVIAIQGEYQYAAPDGTNVKFSYVADENGYQPKSDSLPVAPEVPVAIARALEYIAAHPPQPEQKPKY